MVQVDSEELRAYVEAAIDGIRKGVPTNHYLGPIRFKISVGSSREAGGALKVFVADVGGKYTKEELSQIEFEVIPPFPESSKIQDTIKLMMALKAAGRLKGETTEGPE